MVFHFLSSTAENYLTAALTKISNLLGLPEEVAGVTLLAFANGAPDVITSVVASNKNEEGITLAIGSIFGAGLFCTTVVLACVILASGENGITNRGSSLVRDISFYLVGTTFIIILAVIGEVRW